MYKVNSLSVLCVWMPVTFFFFERDSFEIKMITLGKEQEIDSRNIVITYTERMDHT